MIVAASIKKTGELFTNEVNEAGITEGCIGYWDFREGSGTAFYNKINPASYPGIVDLTYSAWSDYGIITDTQALREKVYVPLSSNDYFAVGDMTITCKFKLITKQSSSDYIIDRRSWNSYVNVDNKMVFIIRIDISGTNHNVISTQTISVGTWYDVTFLYHPDSGGGAGYIKVYINGVLGGTISIGSDVIYPAYAALQPLRWGMNPFVSIDPTNAEFRDTKIFNRILSDKEIASEAKWIEVNNNKQIVAKEFNEETYSDGQVKFDKNGIIFAKEFKEEL